ncbi:hypothetical protein D9757_003547 [Collybiopsis confluens]|uniref:intramembrane prenyl-peptidase Rce1 n=1 Tax=Collybiopsis confluens TaxID=2823264 RepID=A0A8H5HLX4_9AGAR|nr:hypothetical protein D9757_005449 [Collybiopsis confluens]KAF5389271.1 hypothetical protein D9757_003547 [Collybiopsis confluens]
MEEHSLSSQTSHLLGLAFAGVYVGSIYVSKSARLVFSTPPQHTDSKDELRERQRQQNERWRDDPDVIKARVSAVSIAAGLCVAIVCCITGSIPTALASLGLWPAIPRSGSSLLYAITPHLVTPLLFLGPLYGLYLSFSSRILRRESLTTRASSLFCNWIGFRNYAVAPVTEEIVFRACVLSVYLLSPEMAQSRAKLVFHTPLNFGIAHLHHAWDTYNRYGRTSAALRRACLESLFQMAYTTLFGAHCAFMFLQTRQSIFVPITAHIFCNIMGFPNYSADMRTGASEGRKGAMMAAYLFGIAGFAYSVMPMGRWWWCCP